MDEVTRAEFDRLRDEDARQNRRIQTLEDNMKTVHNLAMSVQELAINMKAMLAEQTKQGARLDAIEKKPAESWGSVQRTFLNTIIGALAGAIAIGIMQMLTV